MQDNGNVGESKDISKLFFTLKKKLIHFRRENGSVEYKGNAMFQRIE